MFSSLVLSFGNTDVIKGTSTGSLIILYLNQTMDSKDSTIQCCTLQGLIQAQET